VVFIGVTGLLFWLVIIALGLSQDSDPMPTIRIPLTISISLDDQ
jgi:hypothetical protein